MFCPLTGNYEAMKAVPYDGWVGKTYGIYLGSGGGSLKFSPLKNKKTGYHASGFLAGLETKSPSQLPIFGEGAGALISRWDIGGGASYKNHFRHIGRGNLAMADGHSESVGVPEAVKFGILENWIQVGD